MFHTVVCDLLNIRYPLLQGAMQGGGGPELVAAVSEAGGLGVLPTFGGTEDKLWEDIDTVKARTGKPFGVNITAMGRGFTESRARIIIEAGVPVCTTGRADPGEKAVKMLKDAGVKVVSIIPTVELAKRMEHEGADAIVASGTEAGGHVGTIATMPLVPMVVDAVKVPVIATGGIGDARGFLAAFALGAQGVQIGTRFMAMAESDLNVWGREQLLRMRETDTIISRAMTGSTVRCVTTPELKAYEDARLSGASKKALAEFRKAVVRGRNTDKDDKRQSAMGQIGGMIHDVRPVGEFIEEMISEAARLASTVKDIAGR